MQLLRHIQLRSGKNSTEFMLEKIASPKLTQKQMPFKLHNLIITDHQLNFGLLDCYEEAELGSLISFNLEGFIVATMLRKNTCHFEVCFSFCTSKSNNPSRFQAIYLSVIMLSDSSFRRIFAFATLRSPDCTRP